MVEEKPVSPVGAAALPPKLVDDIGAACIEAAVRRVVKKESPRSVFLFTIQIIPSETKECNENIPSQGAPRDGKSNHD
jgi:hypothetical protein